MSGPGSTSDDYSFAQIIGEMEEELAYFDRVAGAEVYYGPEDDPAKTRPAAAPAAPPKPSWWSQHGGELTKGVLDVASPWIQTGLTKAGLPPTQRPAAPPPPMQMPPPAKTNITPWLIGGGVVLGLGMLVLLLRRK